MATSSGKRKRKGGGLIWVLIIGGILALVFVLLMLGGDKKSNAVRAEVAALRTIVSSVTESGLVEPVTEVKVASDVSGEVIKLDFQEGKMVKRGDVLITVRPESFISAFEQAEASVKAARASYMNSIQNREQAYIKYLQDSVGFLRQDTLFRQRVVSKMEWEQAKLQLEISKSQFRGARANVESALFQIESRQASLKTAQTDLDKTTIIASMSGIITKQNIKEGERVVGTQQMEGTELCRIADLSRMQVKVKINENDIIHIRIGDSAHVEVDAFEGKRFRGKVREIAYSASSADLGGDQITTFEVKVEIDTSSYMRDPEVMAGIVQNQSPFRPGMSSQVEIFTEREEDQVTVPIQAVTIRRDAKADEDTEPEQVVFVLKSDLRVEKRRVETGISDDRFIIIRAGLAEGERIVSGPYKILSKDLKDGMKVKILRGSSGSGPAKDEQKEVAGAG